MAMVWKNSEAFKKHVEQMRMFRQSHPDNLEVRVALLENMPAVYILYPVRETGGSRGSTSTMDWSALVPIGKVTARGFSSN